MKKGRALRLFESCCAGAHWSCRHSLATEQATGSAAVGVRARAPPHARSFGLEPGGSAANVPSVG